MKLTNLCFVNGFTPAFMKLTKLDLPVSTSFRLKSILWQLKVQETLFNESRQELINKYSEKDENWKPALTEDWKGIKIEKIEEFNKEFNDLVSIEFEVISEKIKLNDDIKLSVADIEALEPILDL